MAVLDLRGIICDKTQEAIDEPYLRAFEIVRGRESTWGTIWGPRSMDDGDARSINWGRAFQGRIRIELWEHDRRRDDHIGDLELDATDERGSEQSYRIVGKRAKYRLIYAVNPQRAERFVLHLRSLICDDAQERKDEPYLVVNGATVGGPSSMRTGQSRRIEREETIYFSGNAIVELWERDPARSERIGGPLRIYERLARIFAENPRRLRRSIFHGDRGIPGNATYRLIYSVSREEVPPGPGPDR